MAKASYTQGPWTIRNQDGYLWRIYARDANISGVVATVNTDWPGDAQKAEQRANAYLIAAAPDLIEAVYAALPFVEDALNDPAYKKGAVAKHLKQMRDAISKAEGDQ